MRLAIDLDGVVANFTAGWMRFYNAEFGTDLAEADSQNWGDLVDLTHFENIRQFWHWSSNLEGRSLFWHLEPFPGAVESLYQLRGDGHKIVIVTTKPGFAVHDTFEWIARNRLPTREVHMTAAKWKVDCDAYLDDSPSVIQSLVENRPERLICRYIRPWNSETPGTMSVADFGEFRALLAQHNASP